MEPVKQDVFKIPTEEEIEELLTSVQDILEDKTIDWTYQNNPDIKEGFEAIVDILADDRKTYAGLSELKSTQARAMGVVAVDYLNGMAQGHKLLGVPIRRSITSRLKK